MRLEIGWIGGDMFSLCRWPFPFLWMTLLMGLGVLDEVSVCEVTTIGIGVPHGYSSETLYLYDVNLEEGLPICRGGWSCLSGDWGLGIDFGWIAQRLHPAHPVVCVHLRVFIACSD